MFFCFILKLKITLFYLLSFVFTSCTTPYHSFSFRVARCHLLPLVVFLCHWLSLDLSLFVIGCHLLSLVVPLVVICCTTRCHSLSLVVIRCTTRCHSLPVVVTRYTTRLVFYKPSNWISNNN